MLETSLNPFSPTELACPSCHGAVAWDDAASLTCAGCARIYPVADGVPMFGEPSRVFDWGVPAARMARMAHEADVLGWRDAMFRLCDDVPLREAELIWQRTLGVRRLALELLVQTGPGTRVLDVGCGWGTISLHLAERGALVTALDQAPMHVRWVRGSARERGLETLRVVQGGERAALPFPDESFDTVILNGVFEWIATHAEGDPEDIQRRFLREVARVLRPDGSVYIGIENRINYKYFLGVPEGHVRMRFAALLPRAVTDWYLRRRRGTPFRQYTYSVRGYRKLLQQAGFDRGRWYVTWPHYGSIVAVWPADARPETPVSSRHPAARRPGRWFAPAFGITGSRVPRESPLLGVLRRACGGGGDWRLDGALFRVTSTGKAVVRVRPRRGPRRIVRIGLVPQAGRWIRAHHDALEWMRARVWPELVASRLPQAERVGEHDGLVYGVELCASGSGGGDVIRSMRTRRRLCADALEFLETLSAAVPGGMRPMDERAFERAVAQPVASLRMWFTAEEWDRRRGWFEDRLAWMRARMLGLPIRVAPRHGDFVPENCLVERGSGRLLSVHDWELFEPEGLPGLDAVTFLGCAFRPDVTAALRARGIDPAGVKFPGYPEMFLDGPVAALWADHLDRLGLNQAWREPLVFMWWVRQLTDAAPLMLHHPGWRRLRVFPVMERWDRLFETWAGVA